VCHARGLHLDSAGTSTTAAAALLQHQQAPAVARCPQLIQLGQVLAAAVLQADDLTGHRKGAVQQHSSGAC
jgi:hypothetical protein